MDGKNVLFIPFFINEIPNNLVYVPIKNRLSKLKTEIIHWSPHAKIIFP